MPLMKLFNLSKTKNRLRQIAGLCYQRNGDPTHPENAADADWQAGYLYGCHTTKESDEDIRVEWEGRGKPGGDLESDSTKRERDELEKFRSWKAGYAAGRFTRLG